MSTPPDDTAAPSPDAVPKPSSKFSDEQLKRAGHQACEAFKLAVAIRQAEGRNISISPLIQKTAEQFILGVFITEPFRPQSLSHYAAEFDKQITHGAVFKPLLSQALLRGFAILGVDLPPDPKRTKKPDVITR